MMTKTANSERDKKKVYPYQTIPAVEKKKHKIKK